MYDHRLWQHQGADLIITGCLPVLSNNGRILLPTTDTVLAKAVRRNDPRLDQAALKVIDNLVDLRLDLALLIKVKQDHLHHKESTSATLHHLIPATVDFRSLEIQTWINLSLTLQGLIPKISRRNESLPGPQALGPPRVEIHGPTVQHHTARQVDIHLILRYRISKMLDHKI
jgi:hypothetical protein